MLGVGEGVCAGVSGAGAEGVLGGKVMGQGSLGHAISSINEGHGVYERDKQLQARGVMSLIPRLPDRQDEIVIYHRANVELTVLDVFAFGLTHSEMGLREVGRTIKLWRRRARGAADTTDDLRAVAGSALEC